MSSELQTIIEDAFERRTEFNAQSAPAEVRDAVEQALNTLESGAARVAEKQPGNGGWVVNQWLKKAVLLSFRLYDNGVMEDGYTRYYDKVAPKFADWSENRFRQSGVRVVPPAAARRGTYIGPGVVLMPSFVNIGAYVDSGTMVDTWATVGSCAQIGKNVHLSGGVGIGGGLSE